MLFQAGSHPGEGYGEAGPGSIRILPRACICSACRSASGSACSFLSGGSCSFASGSACSFLSDSACSASCICRPVSGYGGSLYRDAVAYAVLILILLIKPTGLFGEKTGEKI